MERKAPLPPISRNKKAPKAPESGTPRVGNQLVRMRSQFLLLKDIETGTAPTLALSNTNPEQHSQNTRNRRPHAAPCFFMLSIGPPRSRQKSHAPQGIQARQSPRGQPPSAGKPIGGGLYRADPPLTPPYAQPSTAAHASPVVGRSAHRHHSHAILTTII